MNYKFLIFILGILLISNVMALKSFDEDVPKYGQIKINDWLFFDKADYTLLDYKCSVIDCYAEGEFILYKKTHLFQDIYFKDLNGRDKQKNTKFYIWGDESYNKVTPIFENEVITTPNGTTINRQKKIGENIETLTRKTWIPYTKNNLLDPQNGKWRIEIKRLPNEKVDFILKAQDYDLTEWAWFNDSFIRKIPIYANYSGTSSTIHQEFINITWNSFMTNDFSDLRIVNEFETAELNAWNESQVNGAWIYIGVNFTSPWNSTNRTIGYIYFDNTTPVNAYWNGTKTFMLFDDFNRANSASVGGIWTEFNEGGGNVINITDQKLVIQKGGGTSPYVNPTSEMNLGTSPKGSYKFSSSTDLANGPTFVLYTTGYGDYGPNVQGFRGTTAIQTSGNVYIGTGTTGLSNFNTLRIFNLSSSTSRYRAELDYLTNTTLKAYGSAGTDFKILLMGLDTSSKTAYIDWVYVSNNSLDGTQVYSYGATILNGPDVSLISPANNYYTNIAQNSFIGNASFASGIINVSLYLNGVLNETNTSGVNVSNYTFTKTLSDNNYTWLFESCSTGGVCADSSSRVLVIDTTSPTFTLNAPANTQNYKYNSTNDTINVTTTDLNLNTCWYSFNGGANTTYTCNSNFTINITKNANTLNLYANDSAGNIGASSQTLTYKIIEISQSYQTTALEGTYQNFTAVINLASGYSISYANLNYSGVNYTGGSSSSGDRYTLSYNNLLMPSVNSTTNYSFNWLVSLNDATLQNLTSYNQTITNLSLDNCASGTITLFNLTSVDEATQVLIPNASIEVSFSIYDSTKSVLVSNFSGQTHTINPYALCLNNNLTGPTSYLLDGVIKYYKNDTYATEYYNLQNFSLTNTTTAQNITLYDLNETDSTEFRLTFKDSSLIISPDTLIYVNRQYIPENTFKTIELPLTDSNGQAVIHLVRNSVIYNLVAVKNNEIIGTLNNIIAFCEDIITGNCIINFNAIGNISQAFDYIEEVGIIANPPTFNEATKIFTMAFTSSDGTSKEVNLTIKRTNTFGTRVLCSSQVTSSSGTLTCDTSASNLDNSTLMSIVSVDDIEIMTNFYPQDNEGYGFFGYLVAGVMTLSFILMFGSTSKSGMILGAVGGLIASLALSLIQGGIIGIGSIGIWAVIAGVIFLWKLNRGKIQ